MHTERKCAWLHRRTHLKIDPAIELWYSEQAAVSQTSMNISTKKLHQSIGRYNTETLILLRAAYIGHGMFVVWWSDHEVCSICAGLRSVLHLYRVTQCAPSVHSHAVKIVHCAANMSTCTMWICCASQHTFVVDCGSHNNLLLQVIIQKKITDSGV